MRTDPSRGREFFEAEQWNEANLNLALINFEAGPRAGSGVLSNSFSGNERNRMFLQSDGNFDEVSHVSGADFRQDGRGFALLDFDRDGWLDMGVISTQRPKFRLLRNTIGDGQKKPNCAVYISLVGGHDGIDSQTEWSPRDAYGATFVVKTGVKKRVYQLSCGEGLSTQNSKWVHVGMSQDEKIDRIDVTWPSGKKTTHEDIVAGSRVILFEDGLTEQQSQD